MSLPLIFSEMFESSVETTAVIQEKNILDNQLL